MSAYLPGKLNVCRVAGRHGGGGAMELWGVRGVCGGTPGAPPPISAGDEGVLLLHEDVLELESGPPCNNLPLLLPMHCH